MSVVGPVLRDGRDDPLALHLGLLLQLVEVVGDAETQLQLKHVGDQIRGAPHESKGVP